MHRGLMTAFVLVMLALVLAPNGSGKTIIVDDDWARADYSSIQDAVNNSVKDDMIRVYTGIYNETVYVDETVEIRGNGTTRTFINGTNGTSSVVYLASESIVLRDLTVETAPDGKAGIYVGHLDCTVEYVRSSWSKHGIYVTISDLITVRNSEFSYNYVNGIMVKDSEDAVIRDNEIFENGKGIRLSRADETIILSCDIQGSQDYGIYIFRSDDVNIRGCDISDNNGTSGVWVDESDELLFEENDVARNEGDGVVLTYSYYAEIDGSDFIENGLDGLDIRNSDYASVAWSRFDSNVGSGLYVSETWPFYIEYNTIELNNQGIGLLNSPAGRIKNNFLKWNKGTAIRFDDSSGARLRFNRIIGHDTSIYLKDSEDALIFNCTLRNQSTGIDGIGSRNATIEMCNITNSNRSAIYVYNSKSWTIDRNNFSRNSYHAIHMDYEAEQAVIARNNFYVAREQNQIAVDVETENTWYVNGVGNYWSDYEGRDWDLNTIGDTPYQIYGVGEEEDLYPLLNPYGSKHDATIIVDDDWDGADFSSIGQAILSAQKWDTIYLHEGDYMESIAIPDTIQIVGNGSNNTTYTPASPVGISITRNYSLIRGISFWGSGISTGVEITNGFYTGIQNCSFTAIANGIGLLYANETEITGCVFNSNMYNSIHMIANSVKINDCNFTTSGSAGIAIGSSRDAMISNCTFIDSLIHVNGFTPGDYASHTFDNITVNGQPLLHIKHRSDMIITGNYGQIILANCHRMELTDLGNDNHGTTLTAGFCTDLKVIDAEFHNTTFGMSIGYSTGVNITNSKFRDSTIGLIIDRSAVELNSTSFIECPVGIFQDRESSPVTPSREYLNIFRCIFRSNTYGMVLKDIVNATMARTTFRYNVNSVHLEGSKNITLAGNNFAYTANIGLEILGQCSNVTVSKNDFYMGGSVSVYSQGNCTRVVIHHNNFINGTISKQAYDEDSGVDWVQDFEGNYWSDLKGKDNNLDGILDRPYRLDGGSVLDQFPLLEQNGSRTSITWVVDDDNGSWAHFDSIQTALNFSSEGQTIFVFSGTYNENIDILHPVTLVGNGTGETIMRPTQADAVIGIYSDHVNVSGFLINGTTELDYSYGIMLDSVDSANITEARVESAKGIGIFTSDSNNNQFYNVSVGYSRFSAFRSLGSNSNQIINCSFSSSKYGISFQSSSLNSVESCLIENNEVDGVYLSDSNFNEFLEIDFRNDSIIASGPILDQIDLFSNQDVDNCTVNGLPFIYLINEDDIKIDAMIGCLYAIESRNLTINNASITNTYYGMFIADSENIYLEGINVNGSYFGIFGYELYDLRLKNSTITNCVRATQFEKVIIVRIKYSNLTSTQQFNLYFKNSEDIIVNSINATTFSDSYGNIRVHDTWKVALANSTMRGGNDGVLIVDSDLIDLSNVNIINSQEGIEISRGTNITISYCSFSNVSGFTFDINSLSNDIEIYNNNMFSGDTRCDSSNITWDDGNEGNYWHDYSGVDEDSNGIGDIPYNISGSAGSRDRHPLMLPNGSRLPITMVVDDDGGRWAQFTSISAAMVHAYDGDTVRVYNGSYAESLIINTSIWIVGNGSTTQLSAGSNSTCVIEVISDDVELHFLQISFDDNEPNAATGVKIRNSRSVFLYSLVILDFATAIDAESARNLAISKPIIRDCNKGILVDSCDDSNIYDATIENTNTGINAIRTDRLTVSGSRFFDCLYGFQSSEDCYNINSNNNVYRTGFSGFSAIDGKYAKSQNDVFRDSTFGAMFIRNYGVDIIDSSFINNSRGIFLNGNTTYVEIEGAELYNNSLTSIFFGNSVTNVEVDSCNFYTTGSEGIVDGNLDHEWGYTHGNYWYSYPGFDLDDNGIGDIPHLIDLDENITEPRPLAWPNATKIDKLIFTVDDDDSTAMFPSISDALNASIGNEVILVKEGYYREDIEVIYNERIIGSGVGTVLDTKTNGTYINGSNSVLANMKIIGEGIRMIAPDCLLYGLEMEEGNLSIYSWNNTVSGCDLRNVTLGINHVSNRPGHRVFDNIMHNMEIFSDERDMFYHPKTFGYNIVGGNYIGGNFWTHITAVDADRDGLSDHWYQVNDGSWDIYPLVAYNTTPIFEKMRVSPRIGSHSVNRTLSFRYWDYDGEIPDLVWASVGDDIYYLREGGSNDTNTRNGKRYWTVIDPEPGDHDVWFMSKNGTTIDYEYAGSLNASNSAPEIELCIYKEGYGASYNFTISYRDGDNDPPGEVELRIELDDNYWFPLRYPQDNSTTNFEENGTYLFWKVFTFEEAGNHSIRATGNDGYEETRVYQWLNLSSVPPQLRASATPSTGRTGTEFRFDLRYWDAELEPPGYVRLFIDNESSWVAETDQDDQLIQDGKWYHGISRLDRGDHLVYFEASDSDGFVNRSREIMVTVTNNLPEIGPVSIGLEDRRYNFSAVISDFEDDRINNAWLVVDYVAYNMTVVRNQNGTYTASHALWLSSAEHIFYILVYDGLDFNYSSLYVFEPKGLPEFWFPSHTPNKPNSSEEVVFSVLYHHSSNEPPFTINVVIDGHPFAMHHVSGEPATGSMYEYSTKLNRGEHDYWFEAESALHYNRTSNDTIKIRNSPPEFILYEPGQIAEPWKDVFVRIKARDNDGDELSIKFWIDGERHKLRDKGVSESYLLYVNRTQFDLGIHRWNAEVSDGFETVFVNGYIIGDNPPEIDIGSKRVKWTSFINLSVVITDRDDHMIADLRCTVDGLPIDLNITDPTDETSSDGIHFWALLLLSQGSHEVVVSTNDTLVDVIERKRIQVSSTGNIPPSINDATVRPPDSFISMEPIQLTAVYHDIDGEPPVNITAVVNGSHYPMILASGDRWNGTYTVEVYLEQGNYSYFITASDSENYVITGSTTLRVRDRPTPDAKDEEGREFFDRYEVLLIMGALVFAMIIGAGKLILFKKP